MSYPFWYLSDADRGIDREDDDRPTYLKCENCGAFISFKNVVTVTYPDDPPEREVDTDGTVYMMPGRPGGTRDCIPCKRCGGIGWEEWR